MTIGDAVFQKQAGSGTWQNFGPPDYSGLFSLTAHAQGTATAVPEPAGATLLFTAIISRRRRV